MKRQYAEWKSKYNIGHCHVAPFINALTYEWQSQSEVAKKIGVNNSALSVAMPYIRQDYPVTVEIMERVNKPTLYRLRNRP